MNRSRLAKLSLGEEPISRKHDWSINQSLEGLDLPFDRVAANRREVDMRDGRIRVRLRHAALLIREELEAGQAGAAPLPATIQDPGKDPVALAEVYEDDTVVVRIHGGAKPERLADHGAALRRETHGEVLQEGEGDRDRPRVGGQDARREQRFEEPLVHAAATVEGEMREVREQREDGVTCERFRQAVRGVLRYEEARHGRVGTGEETDGLRGWPPLARACGEAEAFGAAGVPMYGRRKADADGHLVDERGHPV